MPTQTEETRFLLTANDRTRAVLSSVQRNFEGVRERVNSTVAKVAALAGAGGLGFLVKSTVESNRRLQVFSQSLGVGTEALGVFEEAGNRAGLGSEKIGDILKDTAEKIGDAYRNEGGEAVEVIESLGLNIEQLARLSPDQQLLAIAEGLDEVGTQGEKVQILEALASDASLLLPLLDDNAAGLRAIASEAEVFNAVLSEADSQQIALAGQSFDRIRFALGGVANQITVAVAPLIKLVADRLFEATEQAGGFERVSTGIFEKVSKAAQFTADTMRGLEFVWVGIQFAFSTAADFILSGLADLDRATVDTLNKVPFVELEYSNALQNIAASQRATTERLKAELDAIANSPPPSEGIAAFFAKVKAEAGEAAERVAVARAQMNASGAGGGSGGGELEDSERARLVRQLEQVETTLMSEEERLFESLARRQFMVEENFEQGLISEQRRQELILQLEQQFEAQRTEIAIKGMTDRQQFEAASYGQRTKMITGELEEVTRGVATHNKQLFEINKVAGISNAIISTYEGVSKTLETYPWPLAGVMAAIHLAAGLAQVRAIQSASFGGGASGGGGLSGGGGGQPAGVPPSDFATAPNTRESAAPQVQITVNGDWFDHAGTREQLVEMLQTAVDNDEFRRAG